MILKRGSIRIINRNTLVSEKEKEKGTDHLVIINKNHTTSVDNLIWATRTKRGQKRRINR